MNQPISKIIYCQDIALVTLPEVNASSSIIAEILTAISDHGVNVDMISQTAPQGGSIALAFTVSGDAIGTLLPVINSLKPKHPGLKCEISGGMNKINFYDADMVNTPGVAARVFALLGGADIAVTMITTSTVDISILVEDHQLDAALAICRQQLGIEPEEVPFA